MSPETPQWSSLIVTPVHGTFAREATWVNPEGSIATALKARFGEAVLIDSIRWSGGNSFGARREATELLRQHVLKPRPGSEDVAHIVIAHSHAENVVAYAARDLEVDAKFRPPDIAA
jgi:hypothetical protein